MGLHEAASQLLLQALLRTKLRKMETEPVGLREALDALCGQPPQAALQECRFRRKGPLPGELASLAARGLPPLYSDTLALSAPSLPLLLTSYGVCPHRQQC